MKTNHWLANTLRDLASPEVVVAAFQHIVDGSATPAQVGSLLTAFHLEKVDEDPEIIAKCAAILRRFSLPIPQLRDPNVVDIVGTGGDGLDTFNASTAAAVVVAGCGVRVAKVGFLWQASRCQ